VADPSGRDRLRSFAGSTDSRAPPIRPLNAAVALVPAGRRRIPDLPQATICDTRRSIDSPHHATNGQMIMANKDSQKANVKKTGKSLKEKRAAKKAKVADKSASHIPSTGH
jgi:hypothetical protein